MTKHESAKTNEGPVDYGSDNTDGTDVPDGRLGGLC